MIDFLLKNYEKLHQSVLNLLYCYALCTAKLCVGVSTYLNNNDDNN